MITFIKWLWPRAEVRRLTEDRKSLLERTKLAEDRAAVLEARLDEAVTDAAESRKENISTLKRMVNVQMYAAGSKLPMFEDVGPRMPEPKEFKKEDLAPVGGRQRASQIARGQRSNFLEQFLTDERAKVQSAQYINPAEDVFEGAFPNEESA